MNHGATLHRVDTSTLMSTCPGWRGQDHHSKVICPPLESSMSRQVDTPLGTTQFVYPGQGVHGAGKRPPAARDHPAQEVNTPRANLSPHPRREAPLVVNRIWPMVQTGPMRPGAMTLISNQSDTRQKRVLNANHCNLYICTLNPQLPNDHTVITPRRHAGARLAFAYPTGALARKE